MDNMVYIIKNSGDIAYVFDSKEERQAKLMELLEAEKKYRYTHYYYDTEDIPAGEYVCKYICKRPEWLSEHWVKGKGNEKLGLNVQEYLNYLVALDCRKCPFAKCSEYKKEDDARVMATYRKRSEELEEAKKKIIQLTRDLHCRKCEKKICDSEHCMYCKDAGKEMAK